MSDRVTSFQAFRDSIPRDRLCARYGAVTRYHGCPRCTPKTFGQVLIATSPWIQKDKP